MFYAPRQSQQMDHRNVQHELRQADPHNKIYHSSQIVRNNRNDMVDAPNQRWAEPACAHANQAQSKRRLAGPESYINRADLVISDRTVEKIMGPDPIPQLDIEVE